MSGEEHSDGSDYAEQLPPIRLEFHEQEFVIFPAESTAAAAAPELHIDATAFWEPLESFFVALRVDDALGVFLEEDTALNIDIPALGLGVYEDDVYVREVSLHDIFSLHLGLGHGQDLSLVVTQVPRFIAKYNMLATQLNDAVGEETLYVDAEEEDEEPEDGEDGEDEEREEYEEDAGEGEEQHGAEEEEEYHEGAPNGNGPSEQLAGDQADDIQDGSEGNEVEYSEVEYAADGQDEAENQGAADHETDNQANTLAEGQDADSADTQADGLDADGQDEYDGQDNGEGETEEPDEVQYEGEGDEAHEDANRTKDDASNEYAQDVAGDIPADDQATGTDSTDPLAAPADGQPQANSEEIVDSASVEIDEDALVNEAHAIPHDYEHDDYYDEREEGAHDDVDLSSEDSARDLAEYEYADEPHSKRPASSLDDSSDTKRSRVE